MDDPIPYEITAANPGIGSGGTRKLWCICLLLTVLTAAVFGRTLGHDFINFDDDLYVYRNALVSHGLTLPGLVEAFTRGSSTHWDPLTVLSRMLDCQVYGLHPVGHHLTNLLLHIASVLLCFLVLRRMTGALWRSAFVAVLFAIHPLRVESVAWITERKDVLSGLFFFLTLGAYARYAGNPKLSRYLWVLLCFVLGLMSKAMLVTLPFVLLLLDYWPLNRFHRGDTAGRRRLLLEKVPLLVLSLVFSLVTMAAQSHSQAVQSLQSLPFAERAANALSSWVVYLWQTVWPVNLAIYYPYPSPGPGLGKIMAALLVLAGISTCVLLQRRRQPCLLTGWLWDLGMLVPVIGLVQSGAQAHADRFTYLPQIGLFLAFAWLAGGWAARSKARCFIAGLGAALVVAALSACAFVQTSYWRNSETLWVHTLRCTGPNPTAEYKLGEYLLEHDRAGEAVLHFAEAARLKLDYVDAYNNLGNALARIGRPADAARQYATALVINPDYAAAHINLGNVLSDLGRLNEAVHEYQLFLKVQPDDYTAHHNLGSAWLQLRRPADAVFEFEKCAALNPADADAQVSLGSALLQWGRLDDALIRFQRALEINPNFALAQRRLGQVAFTLATYPVGALRDGPRAVRLAERAAALSKNGDPAILQGLAAAYAETGRFSEAMTAVNQALTLASAQSNRALVADLQQQRALYETGQPFHQPAPAP